MLTAPLYGAAPLPVGGGDPLGTAPVNEMLYRTTFPGINNVVRYIRVYSAICWMVQQIKLTAAKDKDSDILELTKIGLEKIQLLLTWYNGAQGIKNLPGNGRVYPIDDTPVELRFHTLIGNNARIALENDPAWQVTNGAHYLTAPEYRPGLLRGFASMKESDKIRNTFHLLDAGQELALAYGQAIAGHPRAAWLADLNQNHITLSEVSTMGSMLDMTAPSIYEQQAFLSQYYPLRANKALGPNWQNRRAGLTLALRALEAESKASGLDFARATTTEIRFTMARGMASNGEPLNLKGLENIHAIWANLQLRQYLRMATDVLFRYVESWTHDAVVHRRPRTIEHCAQGVGVDLENTLPGEFRALVAAKFDELKSLQGDHPSLGIASVVSSGLDLDRRTSALRAVANAPAHSKEQAESLVLAYEALVFCALEAENMANNPHFTQQYPNDRFSFARLRQVVGQYQDKSPAAFMSQFIQHHIILSHFQVARDRSEDGNNRFRILNGDNGLERALDAKGLYEVGELQDLLRNALLLATQCDLASRDINGNFAITERGLHRLQQIADAELEDEMALD